MMEKLYKRPLWTLFSAMLTISAFTFGGGFVIVSLMKKKFVDELHWLTEEEMLDMTALSQSAPGPIAVNAAILVGRRIAGVRGMLFAVTGTLIPPIVTEGAARLHTKTVEEMAQDRENARKNAAEADKAKERPAAK
jgi:chromate transporter